ncbi:hypothetical protein NPV75_002119 [Salmonella enterica]|nr:hypothetical protein [Salmonella enterica]
MKIIVEVPGSWRQEMTKRHRKYRHRRTGQKMIFVATGNTVQKMTTSGSVDENHR